MKPMPFAAAAALCGLITASHAADPAQIVVKSGCATCHTVDKKLIGPNYKEIAGKYKGRADAVALLSDHVRKGSQGVWGPVPMVPSDATKISDADLKAVLTWILKTPV